ncbi:ethanolamine ammonia-lyase [Halovibrio salipaludis]|uniref:Ethanolamine ammonia-lyase small subunit n=1 Tax=Halovibrio salipaludis TaxID=2032626 RepID=A0A2A2FBY1_9GAMM|nr:ethanolamine ammonia-lyase subunit EutC [Halovibrio salipaludis]PAU82112.1 ethanolamine ammonia-lyase [Halovibrio salipaludis]
MTDDTSPRNGRLWDRLKAFTDARIGLGCSGVSLPTHQLLTFQMAHAQARDAVHWPLDVEALCEQVLAIASPFTTEPPLRLRTQASDRMTYVQRPDLGRVLSNESRQQLQQRANHPTTASDLAIVMVDGLSALAVQTHAPPFLEGLFAELEADEHRDWQLAPLTVVQQGRVAIGDDVGELLNARAVLVLIGERPGLSSPDSLGLYLTWGPCSGMTDADRNCVSNVRPAGLKYPEASSRVVHLLSEAFRRQLSGVQLKERTDDDVIEHKTGSKNFLVS